MFQKLQMIGWNDQLDKLWADLDPPALYKPARVVADFGSKRIISDGETESVSQISGKLEYESSKNELPKVGDWVMTELSGETTIIHGVLPRSNELARRSAGTAVEKQLLATNVDAAIIVQGLDNDFNLQRLKRYLFQIRQSTIRPIIVLNKKDLNPNWAQLVDDTKRELGVQTVFAVDAESGEGLEQLDTELLPGKLVIIVGSSGVGKSTITNQLLGRDAQKTSQVRQDDSRGRHTTTHRQVFRLPSGALLMDTPGIRELQLWGELNDNISPFIQDLSLYCKFSNCQHNTEPGCAVVTAINEGLLSSDELVSFNKFKDELAFLQSKVSSADKSAYRQKQRKLHIKYRNATEKKRKERY